MHKHIKHWVDCHDYENVGFLKTIILGAFCVFLIAGTIIVIAFSLEDMIEDF